MHRLFVLGDGDVARAVDVDEELLVGRAAECDLSISDQRLSRRHCRVYVADGRLYVEDLGSPNGTFVNGRRIKKKVLSDGDLIAMGKTTVRVGDEVKTTTPSTPDGPAPDLVKPVELALPPDLEDQVAREYFDAIGVGDETMLEANVNKLETIVKRTRNFVILHEVSKRIQREHDPKRMLAAVVDLILNVANGDRGYVAMLDADGVPRETIRRERTRRPTTSVGEPRLSRTVLRHVIDERCGVICGDPTSDERFQQAESLFLTDTRSLMAVPIIVQNRVLGLIGVESSHMTSRFSENDLDLLSVTAATVGVALENRRLQDHLVRSEQMAAIGRLATGIAHEVKNHLSPFMLADMIRRRYPDDAQIQDAAEIMLEAQQHILDLVSEIKSFVSGSPTELRLEAHDLAQVVEGVVRFMDCDAKVKQIDVSLLVHDRPLVEADNKALRQVLVNLIKNAADAVDPTTGRIEIAVAERDGRAVVGVRDNGRGIPEEAQARIFEPFFTTKGDRGLGLGLDISKKIVEAHGGTLTFTSAPGAGTTFRIELPLGGDTTAH